MSIRIDQKKCIGCGKCTEVCPGNLISLERSSADSTDHAPKAQIRIPEDCWGCTGCVKACPVGAIGYYLGADIGGQGAVMTVKQRDSFYDWNIRFPDGRQEVITVDRRSSNRY